MVSLFNYPYILCDGPIAHDSLVSSVAWLENDVFFMVYTPNTTEDDMGMNPESFYYIITRRKGSPFLIQRLPGICSTMGFSMKRSPAYNFIVRLRDYKPYLKDILMISSTASTDIGLVTRSEQPLASDEASKNLVNQFTTTEVNDDAKRASIPLKDSVDETSVIGLAADLSCSDTVLSPIFGSDISESSTPLPGLFLLNNDGVLSSWWLIYSEAIRQKVPFSGLSSVPSQANTQAASQVTALAPAQQQPAFGQSAFGSSTAPQAASTPAASTSKPAFGQSSFGNASPFGASAFGKPAGAGAAFGSPSIMGATAFGKPASPGSFGSPGGAPAFGKPSFGTPSAASAPSTGFGQTNTPGQQPKFGASGFGTGSPFGQPSSPAPAKSLLGTGSGTTGGGFSSFSGGAGGGSGFGGFAAAAKPGESPFAKASGESSFGKPATESPFGKPATESPFGKPATNSPFAKTSGESAFAKAGTSTGFGGGNKTESAFASTNSSQVKNPSGGGGSNGFVLGSSFKPDGTAASDEPKSNQTSSGAFSLGGSFDDMLSSPNKTSPQPDAMDDMDDAEEAQEQPSKPQATSLFGKPTPPAAEPAKTESTSIFGKPTPAAPTKTLFGNQETQPPKPSSNETTTSPFSFFGNNQSTKETTLQNRVTSPASEPSDKTVTPMKEITAPNFLSSLDAPLPPDPTTRASYAPGDTSASSNVSKSSVEDAPLPPDFTTSKKEISKAAEAPLPPDFLTQKKSSPKDNDAPLPPDFLTKKPASKPDDAPLPPDFISKPKKASSPQTAPSEEAVPIPDGSDADSEKDSNESDFSDSGEEITHDDTKAPSPKPSTESSFTGLSDKGSGGGLFSGFGKPAQKPAQPPRQLFGEIPKQPLLPPPGPAAQTGRDPYRSPSPTRGAVKKAPLLGKNEKPKEGAGSALASRKASLTHLAQQNGQLRKPSDAARESQARLQQAAQQRREEEEALSLSDDDEDERLRADLARPVEPVSTLDPFLPHQNYTGDTAKPGIPGMIERLYRDINSMVDTLGINARSLESYLLYQQPSQSSDAEDWAKVLESDQPAAVLDKQLYLHDIRGLDDAVVALNLALDKERVDGVDEKLEQCRELLTKDIVALRGQCASIRKTLDTYTDAGAILVAPLSSEHAALQHDLRTTFTQIQARIADLEEGVTLLRAKIADVPRTDGDPRQSMRRPTVEAVTSTIATMMSMAERKSSDIDVLEAQMRKLGVDTTSPAPASREGSPFATPRKNVARFPTTPGSRGSFDGSAYHTPESTSHVLNFRGSINGSAKASRLRSVEGASPIIAPEETAQWKVKTQRRRRLVENLKDAIEKKDVKVRSADDL